MKKKLPKYQIESRRWGRDSFVQKIDLKRSRKVNKMTNKWKRNRSKKNNLSLNPSLKKTKTNKTMKIRFKCRKTINISLHTRSVIKWVSNIYKRPKQREKRDQTEQQNNYPILKIIPSQLMINQLSPTPKPFSFPNR
jgi:hypothetical protein